MGRHGVVEADIEGRDSGCWSSNCLVSQVLCLFCLSFSGKNVATKSFEIQILMFVEENREADKSVL